MLHNYGVSYSDAVALVTAANEPLQDPSKVGNGLKSIAINLAGIATDAKKGEMKLNKTAKALLGIAHIDVYSDKKKGQLKSMVQILDELKGKWKNLSDDERAGISEAIAGKHRANVFQALMTNYDQFKKIRKEFANNDDFGSAERENEQYINSFAGKMNKLKETFTGIGTQLINSNAVYGSLDAITALTSGLSKLFGIAQEKGAGVSALLSAGVGIHGFLKGFKRDADSYDKIMEEIASGGKRTRKAKKPSGAEKLSESLRKSDTIPVTLSTRDKKERGEHLEYLNKVNSTTEKTVKAQKELNKEVSASKKVDTFVQMSSPISSGKEKLIGFGTKAKELGKNIGSSLISGFSSAGITFGISFAIEKGAELAYNAYDRYAHGLERTKEGHVNQRKAIENELSANKKNLDWIKQNASGYEDLRKKVLSYQNIPKDKLSAEQSADIEKWQSMARKMAEVFPNIATQRDANGNPLMSYNRGVDSLIKNLERLEKVKQRALEQANTSIFNDNIQKFQQGERNSVGLIEKINKSYSALQKSSPSRFRESNDKNDRYGSMAYNYTYGFNEDKEKKYQADRKRWESEQRKAYAEKNKTLAEIDKLNAEQYGYMANRIQNDSRFRNMGSEKKDALSEIAGSVNWSNFKSVTEGVMELQKLGKNHSIGELRGLLKDVESVNESYLSTRNFEDYTAGIGKIAEKYKLGRKEAEKFFKGVNRGYESLEQKQEFNYLESVGMKGHWLGEASARGALADKEIEKYYALKNVQEDIEKLNTKNAKSFNKNMHDSLNGLLSSGVLKGTQKDFFKNISKSLDGMDFKKSGSAEKFKNTLSSIIGLTRDLNKEQKIEAKNTLLDKFKDIKNINPNDIYEIAKGISLTGDAILTLYNNLGKDNAKNNISGLLGLEEKVKSNLKNVEDFYKKQHPKLEVDADVKLKLAELELTDNELGMLENAINELGVKNQDKFRSDNARHFKGASDKKEAYKNMAFSNEAVKSAIVGGENGAINKFSEYNSKVKDFNNEYSKFNDGLKQSLKTMSDTEFIAFFDRFKGASDNTKNIVRSLSDASSQDVSFIDDTVRGFKKSGIEDSVIQKTVKVAYKTVGKENAQEMLSLINKLPNETKKKVSLIMSGSKGQEYSRMVQEIRNSGATDAQMEQVFKFSAHIDEGSFGKIHTLKDFIDKLPKDKGKEFKVKVDASQVDAAQKKLNDVKGKDVSINAKDNASGTVNKVTGAANRIPKEKTVVARAKDAASGVLNRIAGLIGSIFSKTVTITTRYIQVGSPTHSAPVGGHARGGTTGGNPFSLPLSNKKLPPQPTQMNPIAESSGEGSGFALSSGLSFGDGYQTFSGDGFAFPMENKNKNIWDYTYVAENFEKANLKGFEYKTASYIDKLKLSVKEIRDSFEHSVNALHEMENALKRVNHAVKMVEISSKRARGSTKIAMLEQINDLEREGMRRRAVQIQGAKDIWKVMLEDAKKDGFKPDKNSDGANDLAFMLKLEKRKKELEKLIENEKNKKPTTGKKKKGQKTPTVKDRTKQFEDEIKEIDKKKRRFEELNKYRDMYEKLEEEQETAKQNIADRYDEQKKIMINSWIENFDAKSKIIESSVKRISNALDIYSIKMRYAFGYEKITLLNSQISKYQEMIYVQQTALNSLDRSKDSLQNKLKGYGFTFEGDTITNYVEHISQLEQTSTLYSEIKNLANQWFDIVDHRIPDANRQIEEHKSKLKDVAKQKLEDTRDVEQKITSMIKKQMEERIKMIEKESNKRSEAIRKRKEEYNEARKEIKYQDNYYKKLQEVKKLQQEIERLKWDNSQQGQKKLQKANEDLSKKIEELNDMADNHVSDIINKNFDDSLKASDEAMKKWKEKNEEKMSESEILKKAQEAIASGLFTNINGEVQSLQSALIDYMNEWEGGLSATGSLIEAELISKLRVATDVARGFESVLSQLGTSDYNNGGYIQHREYDKIANSKNTGKLTGDFNFNLTVNGNVDETNRDWIVGEIKKQINERDKMLAEMIR